MEQAEARRALISEKYRELQEQFHQDVPDYGARPYSYSELVQSLAEELKVTEILDYGAGKGSLRDAMPQYEPELVDNVLDHLQSLAKRGLFIEITLVPANKILPDGRNAHICLLPKEAWLMKLMKRWSIDKFQQYQDRGMFVACSVRQAQ